MQYEFLNNFPRRMKYVGLYALLVRSIISKTSWNDFGFEKDDERINLVFSILLFIMEKSLLEESCTLDDIAAFIDDLNNSCYKKPISYNDSVRLADFIVNVILSNEGRQMTFEGYDYAENDYHTIHIRYLKNSIIYSELETKRTSYILTDDGYNLLLSTLEVEKNLQIPIQVMIFKLHIEKQSYDKAVDNIRTIFQSIRIQCQKIRDAMQRIRRNALEYSVDEYKETLEENLTTIRETKDKFQRYRELVNSRISEYEEHEIQLSSLSDDDMEKLKNLKIIGNYLSMVIEEHQKILSTHMDLKDLYSKELEGLSQVSLIKRFSLQTEVYEKILEHPEALERLDMFFTPLLRSDPEKIYNLNTSFKPHKISRKKADDMIVEDIDFDEEAWEAEQERILQEKRKRYRTSLSFIMNNLLDRKSLTLADLKSLTDDQPDILNEMIPTVEVFKEVMVELIRAQSIDIAKLKEERAHVLDDNAEVFELNYMLLELLETVDEASSIDHIEIMRISDEDMISFEGVKTSDGRLINIRCSNIKLSII